MFSRLLARRAVGPKSLALSVRCGVRCKSSIKEKKIGLIGMGSVGDAVSKNLLRSGFNLCCVYDIDPRKYGSHLPESVTIEKSCRAVTEKSDVILTGLPKPEHIKVAFEGDNGILAGLSAGKIWVDHSTTDYEQTQAFAQQCLEVGAFLLEAPITGGIDGLKRGQMTSFLAGDKQTADEVTPIIQASCTSVLYLGPLGNALVVKVISNMMTGVIIMAAGEGLVLAKKAGIPLRTFWDAMRLSAGNSFVWETGVPLVFNKKYDPDFNMDLICKDMNLGYEVARKVGAPLELHGLVQQAHEKAKAQYGPDAPCYIIPKMLEDALDEPLQTDGFDNWEYGITHNRGSLVVDHENIDL